jgi:adenylate cyclase
MKKDQLSRKLAVILHADVVGSTELVRQDESLAHRRIRDAFQLFSETIVRHNGLAHEIRGDAIVAEFPKASDGVAASIEFQAKNEAQVQELPDPIRPVLRIGIAMGEVVVADNTVTGEGIVLAQRLEQLAESGGICIQGAVYETIPRRLPYEYVNLGKRELKGFDEPIRVYAVKPRSQAHTQTQQKVTTTDYADKPSIAVLPLSNMSGDSEQEYFSDGITEDIITELSRFTMLYVVARHSSFAFKGKRIDIKEIAEKLGAQYIVEGSVRRAGNRTRITAQLIDAGTGNHIWGERYDRELDDIFAVQDEVTRAIVATIAAQLGKTVSENAARKATTSIKSYEYLLQANRLYYRFNPEDNITAALLLRITSWAGYVPRMHCSMVLKTLGKH